MNLKRFENNPLIYPELSTSIGTNINGPSLIRVPDWLPNPLGRYYLYFGHHKGAFIRLAYADRLEGPWKIYPGGTLRVEETRCNDHIASPDVHIDHAARKLRMYFHGPVRHAPEVTETNLEAAHQYSFVSLSDDGIHFTADREILGAPYFRVFQWQEATYATPPYSSKDPRCTFITAMPATARSASCARRSICAPIGASGRLRRQVKYSPRK